MGRGILPPCCISLEMKLASGCSWPITSKVIARTRGLVVCVLLPDRRASCKIPFGRVDCSDKSLLLQPGESATLLSPALGGGPPFSHGGLLLAHTIVSSAFFFRSLAESRECGMGWECLESGIIKRTF